MNILIVSQVLPQWYVDIIVDAFYFDTNTNIDFITGSDVKANVIISPKHDSRNIMSRMICWYKHYNFINGWIKKNINKQYDLILAVSNPPINSFIGLKLKKTFNAPFIYVNWDIYPQCIEVLIKNPLARLVCKLWHITNNYIYPQIDAMVTIGEVVAKSINEKMKRKINIIVIPIAVDTENINVIMKYNNPFCNQYNLTSKFVVLLSGKMGYGHNIEIVIESSRILRNEKEIQFVFIGEGPKYKIVESFIEMEEPENILLLPMQTNTVFPYSIASGDIGIVTQEIEMSHLFIPSKVYSMMAAGMAIIGICSGNDDLSNLVNDYKIGGCITDNDSKKLAGMIMELFINSEKLKIMKFNSRFTAESLFSKKTVTNLYRELFNKVIQK